VPKIPRQTTKSDYRRRLHFLLTVTIITVVLKLVWVWSLSGNGLIGADGESYLSGVDALEKEGLFSKSRVLHYWPAGYPILMWPIKFLFGSNLPFAVALVQSVLFAFATLMFGRELLMGNLRKFAGPLTLLLNLSPTLSLNSLVIGYEVPTASLILLAICALMRNWRKRSKWNWVIASSWLSIACFLQPRIVLISLGVLVPFIAYTYVFKRALTIFVLTLTIVLISPLALAFRNLEANGFFAVSTNLGVTMNIGAGDSATGGYSNESKGVECAEINQDDPAVADRELVSCVLKWYAKNPTKAVQLFANKFIFHWSPWFGPLSNGTSARNPWLKFDPLVDIASKSAGGYQMVFGSFGKVISWLWILSSISFLIMGFMMLKRRGGHSAVLAWTMLIPIFLNSISSMGTIGDNRFRIPTLTLSVALQGLGFLSLLNRSHFKNGADGPPPSFMR
jgi:hypothetical protein